MSGGGIVGDVMNPIGTAVSKAGQAMGLSDKDSNLLGFLSATPTAAYTGLAGLGGPLGNLLKDYSGNPAGLGLPSQLPTLGLNPQFYSNKLQSFVPRSMGNGRYNDMAAALAGPQYIPWRISGAGPKPGMNPQAGRDGRTAMTGASLPWDKGEFVGPGTQLPDRASILQLIQQMQSRNNGATMPYGAM